MKIIVVEDGIDLSKSIVEYIGKENYIVDVGLNYFDADKKINLYELDCSLIDLMLSGGSGLDLV